MRRVWLSLTLTCTLAGCMTPPTVRDGDGGDPGQCRMPENHRPAATPCTAARPAVRTVDDGGSGGCQTDGDCDGGLNGRCVLMRVGLSCSYDECTRDGDCHGGVCDCRNPGDFNANICLEGNCQVDSDCSPCGFCSPSPGGCIPNVGVIGFFCHTPQDECVNDSDCSGQRNGFAGPFCMFDSAVGHWRCESITCAG